MEHDPYADARAIERFLNLGIFRSKYDLDSCTDYRNDIPPEIRANEIQRFNDNPIKPIKTYAITYHNLKKNELITIQINPGRKVDKEESERIIKMLDEGMSTEEVTNLVNRVKE